MVLIYECDNNGEVVSHTNAVERWDLWKKYVETSKRTFGKVDWDFVTREVYDMTFNIDSLNSDTDSVSFSSSSFEVIMKLYIVSFSNEVLSYESE